MIRKENMTNSKVRYVIGIDEVGRGPLAGPVAVGAVCVPIDFDYTFCEGIRDSKKLSAQKREIWNKKIRDLAKKQKLTFAISFVDSSVIDKKGLSFAIRKALKNSLDKLNIKPNFARVYLDGGLVAPREYLYQDTVIRGDDSIPVISMASIVAKVARDRRMDSLSQVYPEYGFHIHKGYGTEKHYKALKKYGLSKIHRKSFLRGF